MATLSLTTHFTMTVDDDDDHVVTGGSTTAADTFTITHFKDQRFAVAGTTLVTLWDDSENIDTFDFLWIESDVAVDIQLVCNEGGDVAGSDLENAFSIVLKAGVPFILSNDDSRNLGDVAGTFNESNYSSEMDTWESTWTADVIDRIECYNTTGGAAKVRIFIGKTT